MRVFAHMRVRWAVSIRDSLSILYLRRCYRHIIIANFAVSVIVVAVLFVLSLRASSLSLSLGSPSAFIAVARLDLGTIVRW